MNLTALRRHFRQRKAAKNQSLFREVNERVKEAGQRDDWVPYEEAAICECAEDTCSERIPLSSGEYERVREHGTWFAVAPSDAHVFPDVEEIVEQHERYWIVEKIGQAETVPETLDPGGRGRPASGG